MQFSMGRLLGVLLGLVTLKKNLFILVVKNVNY